MTGSTPNSPALVFAAEKLDCARARELLAQGADPCELDDRGRNAAHAMARNVMPVGQEAFDIRRRMAEMATLLCEAGLDWGALDARGRSALAILAKMGPFEALAVVLEQPQALQFLSAGPGSAWDVLQTRGGKAAAMAVAAKERLDLAQASALGAPSKGARL